MSLKKKENENFQFKVSLQLSLFIQTLPFLHKYITNIFFTFCPEIVQITKIGSVDWCGNVPDYCMMLTQRMGSSGKKILFFDGLFSEDVDTTAPFYN